MNILVTGGTGFIGSHTIVELYQDNHNIDIVDNLVNSKESVLGQIKELTGKEPRFFKIDLLDKSALEKVFADTQYDLVIHFAGLKAVGESVTQPLKYYENNIGGTLNLLECMKKYGVHKLIFSSSATVYGEQEKSKLDETCQTGTGITNPYGQTKFMIEQIIQDVAVADPDFEAVILRYFNPVGNHPSGLLGEDPNDIPNNLMPIIMRVSRGLIPELSVYGSDYPTVDGTGVRDYIHVVDLARGHVAAINGIKPGVSVYNLGTGKGTSVLEMIKAFEQASGQTLPYKMAPRRPGDLAEVFANPAKANRELGWQAEKTIDDAMRDTLEFLKHQD